MREQSAYCTRCDRLVSQWPGAILSILTKTEPNSVRQGVALADTSGISVSEEDVDSSSLETSAGEAVADGAAVGDGVDVGLGEPPEIFVSSSSRRRFSST